MNYVVGIIGTGVVIIIGVFVIWFSGKWEKAACKLLTERMRSESKKNITPPLEVLWSRSGVLEKFTYCVCIYWFLFVMVLMFMSKTGSEKISSEQMDNIVLAPFVLPFIWIWQLFNSKGLGYFLAAMFVLWLVQNELERLHSKLDQILEELRRK